MEHIDYSMTARDYFVAGCIRKAIREHRARLNDLERKAPDRDTKAVPIASPHRN
ncbi:hypothetical protein [Stenotrophomonas sp. RG-453]|uniref:hypothetical protein n=1 Tax=Stenotrophomonas sp. RG-453 TaxID=2957502 RepID=UPI0029CA8A51|nr:hypothetical protein [Stenotrophomonas sp. RG-453]MDX5515113.1 hypothetical protein [Stenotrophomonas sp. RG-453]